MKRDMELVRKILLETEACDNIPIVWIVLNIEGYQPNRNSYLIMLKIDALRLEGIYSQRFMGFSQPVFGAKNIPQVEQTIVSFGLNESSVWVKDGQMSMIEGSWHSAKKRKFG